MAKKQYNLDLDWVGAAQNEKGTKLEWVANTLRPTLDQHGFKDVKLQGPDDAIALGRFPRSLPKTRLTTKRSRR